ncbi:MAG: hypothetical protein JWM77_2731 [Rhodospirillales bacterium]|jgi:hypothetical protein|nr:hypothetical protein [Rhodospirillales bacterium]
MPERHRRARPLARVLDLRPGDRLDASCACGHIATVNIRRLIARVDPAADFDTAATRVVCKKCGRRSPTLLGFYDGRMSRLTTGIRPTETSDVP